ncbi:unnamed protein product, partial [Ranitomeya imitator]
PYACGQLVNDEKTILAAIKNNSTNPLPWQSLVLTTAKCSSQQGTIFIHAVDKGTDNRQEIKVASHRIHTKYSKDTTDNDIALLKLEETIKFCKHILPICIPQKDFAESVLIPRVPGTVGGWKLASEYMETMPVQFSVAVLRI